MGIPYSYSLELPYRCWELIDQLWPQVSKIECSDGLGPLTTTFLLAMATPIIVVPIERIANKTKNNQSYVDDGYIDEQLTRKFQNIYKLDSLTDAAFFEKNSWSLVKWNKTKEPLNIARDFPQELASCLAKENAATAASKMPLSEWAACLRNAISHGGIAYLDKDGFQATGNSAKMFAFVSGDYKEDDAKKRNLVGIKVLRISEEAFKNFLKLWVIWLRENKLCNLKAA